jgi:uncharacterized protein (UPF0332 family)
MKPDVQALINKAKDSLGAAKTLAKDGYNDFATSRAYYAMFYVAEAMLLQLGLSYSKHSAVISAFGREYAKTGIIDSKFHRWLIDAQDFRNIGDYGIDAHISGADADAVCKWASEFICQAEDFLLKQSD